MVCGFVATRRIFRRFCGRRGILSLVISDNKTFKSVSNILTKLSKETEVIDHFYFMKMTWQFILEKSPWWGGFYGKNGQVDERCTEENLGKSKCRGCRLCLLRLRQSSSTVGLWTCVGSDDAESCLTHSYLV